jgi:hypothetical protein
MYILNQWQESSGYWSYEFPANIFFFFFILKGMNSGTEYCPVYFTLLAS